MIKDNRVVQFIKDHSGVFLFVLFTLLCMMEAASKYAVNEFMSTESYLVLMAFLFMLLFCLVPDFKGNRRLILAMLMLMTIGNLMRGVLDAYSYHDGRYLNVKPDYAIAIILFIAIIILYPKLHFFLSTDIAVALMALLNMGMYVLLFFFGQSVGNVKAWFMGVQLTELIKILFVFVLAGLLSKKQSMGRAILAIVFMGFNAVGMVAISELGTLMLMTFVFIIFMFVYPNKLWALVSILGLFLFGGAMICTVGSGICKEALETSPSDRFVAKLSYRIDKELVLSNGEKKSGLDALTALLTDYTETEDTSSETGETNIQTLCDNMQEKIAKGEWTSKDFPEFDEKSSIEDVTLSEAQKCLAELCDNRSFRRDYISIFCRDDFYGNSAKTLYDSMGSGIGHMLKSQVLSGYVKLVDRFLMQFLPDSMLHQLLGIYEVKAQDQVVLSQKAMQIGGLTGASSHEFISVYVMESDFIFSEIVSFFGFAMGAFVILLFMIIFREGMRIQMQVYSKPFHRGVALGLSLMIFIQAMIIIAGNMGIFPLTGITLPFISVGRTSLYVSVIMMGVLLMISSIEINERNGAVDELVVWTGRDLLKQSGELLEKLKAKTKKINAGAVDTNIVEDDEDLDEIIDDGSDDSDISSDIGSDIDNDIDGEGADEDSEDILDGEYEQEHHQKMDEVDAQGNKATTEDKEDDQSEKPERRQRSMRGKRDTVFKNWGDDDDDL